MKLMPLSPESERVRGAARALAAGEMSENDYRRIRRDAILAFADKEEITGEDTKRRWVSGTIEAPVEKPAKVGWRVPVVIVVLALVLWKLLP